jgi:hypothetical protein
VLSLQDYDTSSDVYQVCVGERFLASNDEGIIIQGIITDVQRDGRNSNHDRVTFRYKIAGGGEDVLAI